MLLEAGAIHECEEHGWMKHRTDPHERARRIARKEPGFDLAPDEAAAIDDMLAAIDETCPECLPD